MIDIRNRWTNELILSIDAENLSGADLYGVDLYGANLRDVNLYGVDLRGCTNLTSLPEGLAVGGKIYSKPF